MSKELRSLSMDCLTQSQREHHEKVLNSPVKIMQVGEGNFLTSFFDWMVDQAIKAGKYNGSIALTCPLNYDGKINTLNSQDKLYTVVQRGFKGDTEIFEQDIISVFSKVFNYNAEWDTFMNIAEQESLDVVISNTTEAGLAYKNVSLENVATEGLYPGKLTAFLMHRFNTLGNISKKLLIFPCELVAENGRVLKEFVAKHAEDFGASEEFKTWVNENCVFLNNLVDRIVPGYPREDAQAYFDRFGYKDEAMSMCEPFFLWAIEGSEELDKILPLKESGLNVQWLESLHDTQLLKVRILNETLQKEILPSLKNKTGNKEEFASTVLGRFRNLHIKHKLESISMNSVSKFQNRLWPTIKSFIEDNNKLPENMMIGLAGLLRFYQVSNKDNGYVGYDFNGNEYRVFDTPEVLEFMENANSKFEEKNEEYVRYVLSEDKLWGEDLTKYLNIVEVVTEKLQAMENEYEPVH